MSSSTGGGIDQLAAKPLSPIGIRRREATSVGIGGVIRGVNNEARLADLRLLVDARDPEELQSFCSRPLHSSGNQCFLSCTFAMFTNDVQMAQS